MVAVRGHGSDLASAGFFVTRHARPLKFITDFLRSVLNCCSRCSQDNRLSVLKVFCVWPCPWACILCPVCGIRRHSQPVGRGSSDHEFQERTLVRLGTLLASPERQDVCLQSRSEMNLTSTLVGAAMPTTYPRQTIPME